MSPPTAPASVCGTVTGRNRAGVVLAVLTSIFSLSWMVGPGALSSTGEPGPPAGVMWLTAGLNLVTIGSATRAWLRCTRGGLRVAAVAMTVSAMLAAPGLLVDGVPSLLVTMAAADVLLTVVVVTLLLGRS